MLDGSIYTSAYSSANFRKIETGALVFTAPFNISILRFIENKPTAAKMQKSIELNPIGGKILDFAT
ncbi:MAG: hypothetical protein JXR73_23635 [Candidatus Omnitrophica bacterium]|nr:hypothetical protein [Candidatus Omnitrophota bacterium]